MYWKEAVDLVEQERPLFIRYENGRRWLVVPIKNDKADWSYIWVGANREQARHALSNKFAKKTSKVIKRKTATHWYFLLPHKSRPEYSRQNNIGSRPTQFFLTVPKYWTWAFGGYLQIVFQLMGCIRNFMRGRRNPIFDYLSLPNYFMSIEYKSRQQLRLILCELPVMKAALALIENKERRGEIIKSSDFKWPWTEEDFLQWAKNYLNEVEMFDMANYFERKLFGQSGGYLMSDNRPICYKVIEKVCKARGQKYETWEEKVKEVVPQIYAHSRDTNLYPGQTERNLTWLLFSCPPGGL